MKAIVSFSSMGRENYNKAMLRLIRSLEGRWDGGKLMFQFDGYVDEYRGVPIRQCQSVQFPQPKSWVCSPHGEIPYQFKLAVIQIAREEGYHQTWWCDSTIQLLKDPSPLLDASDSGIVAFENLGHPLYKWISDEAQLNLGLSNDELPLIPQIMACAIGFDFNKEACCRIFDKWLLRSYDSFRDSGSNRAGFVAHRHDQAVLSALLWQNQIALLPYGRLVYPPHDTDFSYGNDIFFVNKAVN